MKLSKLEKIFLLKKKTPSTRLRVTFLYRFFLKRNTPVNPLSFA